MWTSHIICHSQHAEQFSKLEFGAGKYKAFDMASLDITKVNIANHLILNLHNSDSFKSKVRDFATYMALEANSQGNFLLYSASFSCFIMILIYIYTNTEFKVWMDLWRLKRSIKRGTTWVSETGARPTDNLNVQVVRVFYFQDLRTNVPNMKSLRVIVGYCCQSDVDGEYSHYNCPKTPLFWKGRT